jgi:serine/threonine protein kinase
MTMSFEKAKALFVDLVANVPPGQWDARLAELAGGDEELRLQVSRFLAAHREAGSFLDSPAPALGARLDELHREKSGTVIGPYQLLEQIGEGGFGVVFMAEQQQPLRRKVALKVLKPGMDSRQVIARFEAERQALALMDHANIAHVFDGGETASGRPYFVMELVKGIPITQFCDQEQLPIRQRLELFVSVCQAVQHAHQKGIIHRDLKPSNVMVTLHDGRPVVKVIDFGIAKATGQRLTDKTLFTGFAQLIGTPMYMSPEQAALSGLDVDTRSDIYALGVLLYELLTGTTPFAAERLKTVGYDELRRIIREEEPPRPSTRVSTLGQAATTAATQRKSDPRQLSRLFRGELDWIVMKALEKDRDRRYETASAFAADVQRYLHDEPVQACPPSLAYRFRKFARRNRPALAIGASAALLLAVGVALIAWQWRVAEDRRQQAELAGAAATRSAAKLAVVNRFLIDDLLGQADPTVNAVGDKITVRELLDKAARRIDDNEVVAAEPEVEATIRQTIGDAYFQLNLYGKAEPQLRRALEIRRRVLGKKHKDTLWTSNSLAFLLYGQGRSVEAEELSRENLRFARETLGGEHNETLRALCFLGYALAAQGKLDEAEACFRERYETIRRTGGSEPLEVLEARVNLLFAVWKRGDLHETEALIQENLHGGHSHKDWRIILTMNWKSMLLVARGQWKDAEDSFREGDKSIRDLVGPEHSETIGNLFNWAVLLHAQGKQNEAGSLLQKCVEFYRKLMPDSAELAITLYEWGTLLLERGDTKEAEASLREALALQHKRLVADHYNAGQTLVMLGWTLTKLGQPADGEPLLRKGLDISRKNLPQGDWFTADAESLLGGCLTAQRKYEQAEPLLLSGYKGLLAAAGTPPVTDSWTLRSLQSVYAAPGAPPAHLRQALDRIVQLYEAWDKPVQAAQWRAKKTTSEQK